MKVESETLIVKKQADRGHLPSVYSAYKNKGIVLRNSEFKKVFKESSEIGCKISHFNISQEINRNKIVDFCISSGNLSNLPNFLSEIPTVNSPSSYEISNIGFSSVSTIMNTFSRRLFMVYSKLWKEETKYSSLFQKIVEHNAYQKIIEMNDVAIPFILEEIKNGEVHYYWDYALRKITNKNPVNKDRSSFEEINLDWLAWGEKEGLI